MTLTVGYQLGLVFQAGWAEGKEGPGHRGLWGHQLRCVHRIKTQRWWLLILFRKKGLRVMTG